MLEMQKMMAMMSAQMARIASPVPAVPPQAPSAMVAPTPPLTTRTRLTFPGFGVPPVHRMNLTTPPTAPPPPPASYRQSDVARFKVVGIQRGSVDDIKFSMWNFNNAVATFGLKEIAAGSSRGSTAQVADLKILVVKWVEEDRNIVQFLINKFGVEMECDGLELYARPPGLAIVAQNALPIPPPTRSRPARCDDDAVCGVSQRYAWASASDRAEGGVAEIQLQGK
jgi:hypothetical protein